MTKNIIDILDNMNVSRIYISGAISGVKGYEKQFACMETFLNENGYNDVINPTKIESISDTFTWEECITVDMALLSLCDTIILLKGWENSKGCQLELEMAKMNNYNIVNCEVI